MQVRVMTNQIVCQHCSLYSRNVVFVLADKSMNKI